jgi:hypothetical protein
MSVEVLRRVSMEDRGTRGKLVMGGLILMILM